MAAGAWIEQAFNFVVFVILARLLGAETIGLAAMAVSFLVLAASLVRETFTEYLIAHKDPTPDDFNAVFWCLIALGLALAALMNLLAVPIAGFYGEPEVASFLRALSPVVLMIALTAVPVAILRHWLRCMEPNCPVPYSNRDQCGFSMVRRKLASRSPSRSRAPHRGHLLLL